MPAARSRRSSRRRSVARKVSGGFPVFYPTRLPVGRRLRRKQPLRTRLRTRASTTSRTPTATATAPTGWSLTLELPDGVHYFGVQGIQGWADPPILDNPSLTEDDPRPRVRHLRRRRSGQADRLAPGRQHLLGRRTDLLQTLTNDQMLGIARSAEVIIPKQKPKKRRSEAMSERARADRGDRGRLGRPGHRRLLRRARPPGDRPRHRRREGRGALARRDDDPRAGPRRAARAATPSASPSPPTWASCSTRRRLLFVCVDTPPTYSGDADLSRVRAVVEELRADGDHVLVMKSTVPAGTGDVDPPRPARPRLRLLPRVPQGGLGGRGLHAPRPGRDRRRPRRRGGGRRGRRRSTSRSAARSSAPTSPAPR